MSSSTSLANRGRTGGHPVGLRLFPPLAVNPSLDWKFRLASACNPIAGECGPSAELASYRRATGVQSISRTNDIGAPSILEIPLSPALKVSIPVFAKITVVSGKWSESGVSVHYLADEHWSGSVTETSLPDFPFFSPVSGWPEGYRVALGRTLKGVCLVQERRQAMRTTLVTWCRRGDKPCERRWFRCWPFWRSGGFRLVLSRKGGRCPLGPPSRTGIRSIHPRSACSSSCRTPKTSASRRCSGDRRTRRVRAGFFDPSPSPVRFPRIPPSQP